MIDFRYHIVSIIAVFLALAVGIVLGSTALQDPVANTLSSQTKRLAAEKGELQNQVRQLQAAGRNSDAFAEGVTSALVGGRLAGETVLLVRLPGADGKSADGVSKVLEQAGAQISGTVTITDKYADPLQAQGMDDLVARVAPPGVDLPAPPARYERAALELASALVVTDPAGVGTEAPGGAGVLSAFQAAGFIGTDGSPQRRATAVVLVAGSPPTGGKASDDQVRNSNAASVGMAQALRERSRGAVLCGPLAAVAPKGVVSALRDGDRARERVSSVDGLDPGPGSASARANVALALYEQVRGNAAGHYGVGDGAETAVPFHEPMLATATTP